MNRFPHRVLFVSKYADLTASLKAYFSKKFSPDEVELVCYNSLKNFHEGFYINFDLAFVELESLIKSDFLHLNKEHHNWRFLKLVLLVDRNSSSNLSVLFEKLQEENLEMVLDYITIDNYSNKLVALACGNYCRDSLNLINPYFNNLTNQKNLPKTPFGLRF